MAVITRYIIVRNGVELDKVFDDKRLADAYDKMLDAADNLAAFIKTGDLQLDLNDKTIEQIAVYLAKNGPEVTDTKRDQARYTCQTQSTETRGRGCG